METETSRTGSRTGYYGTKNGYGNLRPSYVVALQRKDGRGLLCRQTCMLDFHVSV